MSVRGFRGATSVTDNQPEAIHASMQVGKKRQASGLCFAPPVAIGDVRTGVLLKPQELDSFAKISGDEWIKGVSDEINSGAARTKSDPARTA